MTDDEGSEEESEEEEVIIDGKKVRRKKKKTKKGKQEVDLLGIIFVFSQKYIMLYVIVTASTRSL